MTKRIPQIEPWFGKEEEQAVLAVLRTGWITEHVKTREFEQMLADFLQIPYVSVVVNGTVSLFLALAACEIGQGDEVLVPDFTMVATANAVVLAGAKPVFVDIDKENLCLNLTQVEQRITSKTRAIIAVSLNGRSPNMEKLMQLAKKNNLFVIEDAAQALGSQYEGQYLGTFGDVGSFSFSTPKVITTGQGGALGTRSKKLYEKIIRLKDFGRIQRSSQDHDEIGYNFKFTDVLAAIGVEQMKKLNWRIKRKKEIYARYLDLLKEVKQVTFLPTDLKDVAPWFIDIIVPDPIKLQSYLKTKGVGTRLFYPAIHTTKPYKTHEKFPNSLWAAIHGLWLPSSSFLTNTDIKRIGREITNFYAGN